MVLAAQEEQPQLPVDGGDKLPQMDAPGGEVRGNPPAGPLQRRAGIVEGIGRWRYSSAANRWRTGRRSGTPAPAARSKITEGFSGGAGAVSRKKLSYRSAAPQRTAPAGGALPSLRVHPPGRHALRREAASAGAAADRPHRPPDMTAAAVNSTAKGDGQRKGRRRGCGADGHRRQPTLRRSRRSTVSSSAGVSGTRSATKAPQAPANPAVRGRQTAGRAAAPPSAGFPHGEQALYRHRYQRQRQGGGVQQSLLPEGRAVGGQQSRGCRQQRRRLSGTAPHWLRGR